MKDQQNLDEFLQRQLARRSYAFEEAHWEAAASLIEARRRKRRFFWLWPLGLALLGCGIALGWALLPRPTATLAAWADCLPEVQPAPQTQQQTQQTMQQPIWLPADPAPSPQTRSARTQGRPRTRQAMPTLQDLLALQHTGVPADTSRQLVSLRVPDLEAMPLRPYRLPAGLETPPVWLAYDGAALWQRHHLELEAGTALATGWGTADLQTSAVVGLAYTYALRPRLGLRVGLRYQHRGGLDSDSTYVQTSYAFGVAQERVTVAPQHLHELVLPLILQYRLAPAHSLRAGLEAGCLLDVSSRVTTESLADGTLLDSRSRQAWGYRQGFRRADLGLVLGYGYTLRPDLRLDVQARYGLRDRTDPAFFVNNRIDRTSQLLLTLSYRLR
ncbi:MAG: hypothetical protein OHK0039_26080 [Bacteroidia bacterium]